MHIMFHAFDPLDPIVDFVNKKINIPAPGITDRREKVGVCFIIFFNVWCQNYCPSGYKDHFAKYLEVCPSGALEILT